MGRISSSIESNEDNRITESLLATDNHISPSSNENQINKIKQISSKYDVCFIFPVNTDIKSNKLFQKEGEEIVRILIQAVGEEDILMYKSARRKLTDNEIITDEDEHKIIVLIRLSNERAVCLSYIKGHKLLANHHELKARAIEGWKANEEKNQPKVHPLVLDMDDDRKDITQYGPFQHIYLKYSHEPEYQTLYYDYHHTSNTVAFSKISKLKLLKDLLDDNYDEVDDGINIDLDKVVLPQSNGNPSIVSAIFPLHDDSALQSLKLSCRFINFDAQSDSRTSKLELKFKHFFPWWLDYTAIKNYFGEKIALYYVFTG